MTHLQTLLLSAAVRAPSGDNTQPWRFVVDSAAGRIAILLDETRDPSPMNAGQRMARIGIGAVLETLLRVAEKNGCQVRQEIAPAPSLAVVRLDTPAPIAGETDPLIAARVSNRRAYDGRPVAADVLARLARQTPETDGVSTHWICGRPRLTGLAALIGRADATMFGEPSMRRAFLANVRFDAPAGAEVDEGLSLASLELSRTDYFGLRMMRLLPDRLLKLGGALRVFAAKARQLVESASGLCLVVAREHGERAELLVGRAMQRAWLALTAEGLAVQPMMSLPVLENALNNGAPQLIASLGGAALAALREDFRGLAPEIGDGWPGFLLRFGFAPPPSGRTGRLPLAAVCTPAADGQGLG